MKSHQGYTCKQCPAVFYKWTDMRQHVSTEHRKGESCCYGEKTTSVQSVCQLYPLCICSLFNGPQQHDVSINSKSQMYISEELTSTTGCHGRDLTADYISPWASTLPLSYPAMLYIHSLPYSTYVLLLAVILPLLQPT